MTFWIPALVTLVIGAIGIDRQAWRDEHSTWWASTIPLPDLEHLLSHVDAVLAPYYLLMRVWILLTGDSVIAMRLPSLLAMAAAAGVVGVIGERLFDRWTGFAAGALFAVLPSISRYAAEARPYSLAVLFATASVLVLLWVLQAPSWKRWAVLTALVTLIGLSHLLALTVLVAHPVALLHSDRAPYEQPHGKAQPRGRTGRAWAIAVGLGLLPVLPLVYLGARQQAQVSWIDSSWHSLVSLPEALMRSAATAGVIGALALLAVLARRWDWRLALLLVWAVGPPLVVFAVVPQLFYFRYLLFTVPAWVLLAAAGARQAIFARQRLAIAALTLLVLLLAVRDHQHVRTSPLPGDQDYQAAAAFVAARQQPSDQIVFEDYADGRESRAFAYELRRAAQPHQLAALTPAGDGRLWWVTYQRLAPPAGFEVVEARTFPGLDVMLLKPQHPHNS